MYQGIPTAAYKATFIAIIIPIIIIIVSTLIRLVILMFTACNTRW